MSEPPLFMNHVASVFRSLAGRHGESHFPPSAPATRSVDRSTPRSVQGRARVWPLLVLLLLPALLRAAPAEPTAAQTLAHEVLQGAGLKRGLVLHLGCGRDQTAGLCAALAQSGNLVVHGLALDAASCARARQAIQAAGVAGHALVEPWNRGPLPYLADLANLIVVEDLPALEARGILRDELLRVLAPGGTLCVRQAGQWVRSLKSRPPEMDDWTHPQHGADGNMVSADRLVTFPLGFRWLEGIPVNVNRWAGCRGWVTANGRVFTLSSTELENVGQKNAKTHYLAARDAWNGLPLWKIDCETKDDGAFLNWDNAGPLVADERCVYAVKKDQVIAAEAATGTILRTYPTKYPPARLLLLEGTLVAACWQEREPSRAAFDRDSLWATWVAKTTNGAVEAYNAATGQVLWKVPFPAETISAADGLVYLLTQTGNPPTDRQVLALDLRTGQERWRVSSTALGLQADLQLNAAGRGYLVVGQRKGQQLVGLSAAEGRVLWKLEKVPSSWTPVVDGALWCGSKKYDPVTGEPKGNLALGIGGQGCTPSAIVNHILTQSRGCSYVELPSNEGSPNAHARWLKYQGARGACMEGMVPANGMFYTAQNNCRCAPGQVYGFVALGPSGEWPTDEDFKRARPVEQGPAFGKVTPPPAPTAGSDWPMYRRDAARSAATPASAPTALREAWKIKAASPGEGWLGEAWRSRIASCLSAPVVAQGLVFVAETDAGRVAAYDAATGRSVWSVLLGSRVDTPPAVQRGFCYLGCHDGYVYALRAQDGQLVWRTRVAPWERRMMAFGLVESVWPAVGAVVPHEGLLYAHAGRTSESDGGIALVALNPETGQTVWASAIGTGPQRMNDLLRLTDNSLRWHHLPIDPKSGVVDLKAPAPKDGSQGGILDGSWTEVGKRRSGNAWPIGNLNFDLVAWSRNLLVTPNGAFPLEAARTAPDFRSVPRTWSPPVPAGAQVEAIALAGNAAVLAGRNKAGASAQATGFLVLCSTETGKPAGQFNLTSPPTYDGLALAGEHIYLSLHDGTLLCFGQ